jgi:hypothetical protein
MARDQKRVSGSAVAGRLGGDGFMITGRNGHYMALSARDHE